jgi:HD-GYP domain-containing protein (c-di-GMP phosphodiesterase class II)
VDFEESEYMKRHPEIGYRICLPLKKVLGSALDVIRHHHERLDGSGYPDGLKGEQIPFLARLIAVVDAFHAMISDRPYRRGMNPENALAEIRKCAGSQFDPLIVEAFERAYRKELEKLSGTYPHFASGHRLSFFLVFL